LHDATDVSRSDCTISLNVYALDIGAPTAPCGKRFLPRQLRESGQWGGNDAEQ
jgi:hypothetical protein